jgi:holliday junction DNA helicase RuvB
VRDYAQVRNNNHIDRQVVDRALRMLSIDEKGLDEMDLKMLQIMIDHYQGGPVGINAIAASIGEEPSTIEEVYEPYLIMQGFLKRTPRGREVTPLGYQHMGKK